MKVILADKAGFCFGVKNIDEKTQEALKEVDNKAVFSYGQLVHNNQYIERRKSEGLQELDSMEDAKEKLDENAVVILRAHGVTKEEREGLLETGATLVDGTCPVLLGIYKLAKKQNEEGKQIVIIGDPDHPEIVAMKSYFDEDTVVIQSEEDVEAFQPSRPTFIISQTTNRRDYFNRLAELLVAKDEGAVIRPTICNATKERQEAVDELSKEVDAMIVIGGQQSSNTEKLAQVAKNNTENTFKIEELSDLVLQTLAKYDIIGVTAGASTPDWIIEEVVTEMDNFSNEEFMEQIEDSMVKIYPKDIVKGTVLAVKEDEVYVDIHYRSDGIIKTDEMSDEERENPQNAFHEGEEIDVYVIKLDDGEGNVVLSTRRVEGLKNWQKLVDKFENDETIEAKVTGENSGGLVVNAMGINGFIPASQITTYYVKNFKQFVGQTLECKIISIDERKRRLVLSSRAVKETQLDEIWDNIVVGEKIKGEVVRMTDFGAFVDLGGVDGLIHVSDISWSRIDKPSDVLEVGQEVEPVVLKANRERNRISLGLKQLAPKPFDRFIENNKAGDTVKGEVVNLIDFGAFVRLEEGVEGLVHVSQIANHHVEKPSDELTVGDEIEVKILDIEEDRQRIALSIRALQEPVEKPREEQVRDDSKFDRKPKKEQKARRERQPKQKLAFDNSSDIGTNLGDLIAAQLDLVDSSADEYVAEADEAVETEEFDTEYADYQEEADVEEVAATEEVEEEAEVQETEEEAEVEEVEEVAEEPASIDDEVIVVEEAEEATEDEEEVDVAEEVEVEEATEEAEETTEDDDETTEA